MLCLFNEPVSTKKKKKEKKRGEMAKDWTIEEFIVSWMAF